MADSPEELNFVTTEENTYDIAGFNSLLLLSFMSDLGYSVMQDGSTVIKQDMGAFTTVQLFDFAAVNADELTERFSSFMLENRFSANSRRIFRYFIFVADDYARYSEKFSSVLQNLNEEFYKNGILAEFAVIDLAANSAKAADGHKISDKKVRQLIEKTIQNYKNSLGLGASAEDVVNDKKDEIIKSHQALGRMKRVGIANPMTLFILVNIIIFIAGFVSVQKNGFDLFQLHGIQDNELIMNGEWWRLFTSMFLHADLAHLTGNMFFLYYLGSIVLRYYSTFEFCSVYILSGMAGNILSLLFTDYRSLGASGAIMGLGGLIIFRMFFGKDAKQFRRSGNYLVFVLMILFNLFYGVFAVGENIDNYGHFGGFIGGFAVAYIISLIRSHVKSKSF